MENTSHLELSDYQRAILNEMGISAWKLFDEEHNQVKVESQPINALSNASKVKSKVDALAKLKQLKVQTKSVESTDSVLVTFPQSAEKLQIFHDVLISLGLESRPLKYISEDQLSQYSGYPLYWTQGKTISLKPKQLITPALVELLHTATKKQLWQELQSVLPLANN
jgi:DNA polymerase III psi subunit